MQKLSSALILPRAHRLQGEWGAVHQISRLFLALSAPGGCAPARAWGLPASSGGPVRSCFLGLTGIQLSRLAGRPVLESCWVVCVGIPLALFRARGRGWQCPLKSTGKYLACPEEAQGMCGCRHGKARLRGGGSWSARRPPCKPRSYKMHFPAYPSGLSRPFCSLLCLYMIDN